MIALGVFDQDVSPRLCLKVDVHNPSERVLMNVVKLKRDPGTAHTKAVLCLLLECDINDNDRLHFFS